MPETQDDRNMQAEIISAANRVMAIIEAGFVTHGSGRYVSFRSDEAGKTASSREALPQPANQEMAGSGI